MSDYGIIITSNAIISQADLNFRFKLIYMTLYACSITGVGKQLYMPPYVHQLSIESSMKFNVIIVYSGNF